jgi:hypothetical protein
MAPGRSAWNSRMGLPFDVLVDADDLHGLAGAEGRPPTGWPLDVPP